MSRKYVVQEGSVSWRMRLRDVDWEKFWLAEILILAIPMMVAVFSTGGHSPVSPRALEIALVVQVSLTALNLFLCIPRGALKGLLHRLRRSLMKSTSTQKARLCLK
jgi:hypothetical protein